MRDQHRPRRLRAASAWCVLGCLAGCASFDGAGIALQPNSVAACASADEAAAVLGSRDDFISAQSPIDRALRLRRRGPVSVDELLDHLRRQALDFTADERTRLAAVVSRAAKKLQRFTLPLPERVLLLKTTGDGEGQAPHTRGAAIVLPARVLDSGGDQLERLFLHELFHVMSRHDREVRAALYGVVGFELCGEIELPPELARRKLTNPDAPRLVCRAEIEREGRALSITPILLSTTEEYPENSGGQIFDFLDFRLLVIEESGGRWRAAMAGGQPWLLDPEATPEYHDKLGRNTGYVIHPEEVLADNFVLLVLGASELPTPCVVEGMAAVLAAAGRGR